MLNIYIYIYIYMTINDGLRVCLGLLRYQLLNVIFMWDYIGIWQAKVMDKSSVCVCKGHYSDVDNEWWIKGMSGAT